jgi:hypothetical protein
MNRLRVAICFVLTTISLILSVNAHPASFKIRMYQNCLNKYDMKGYEECLLKAAMASEKSTHPVLESDGNRPKIGPLVRIVSKLKDSRAMLSKLFNKVTRKPVSKMLTRLSTEQMREKHLKYRNLIRMGLRGIVSRYNLLTFDFPNSFSFFFKWKILNKKSLLIIRFCECFIFLLFQVKTIISS